MVEFSKMSMEANRSGICQFAGNGPWIAALSHPQVKTSHSGWPEDLRILCSSVILEELRPLKKTHFCLFCLTFIFFLQNYHGVPSSALRRLL